MWGGGDCEHQWKANLSLTRADKPWASKSISGNVNKQSDIKTDKAFCSLCGAWKGAYGLEPTPEMYVQHSIEILREIRRVLRKDGVVFWNIGDSYSGGNRTTSPTDTKNPKAFDPELLKGQPHRMIGNHPVIKPKDLCLIPFRVAIAAQESGWWVRSVIIWSKPNPMPESVTDRPTESHEYILMLTKSARYYWDADNVREGLSIPDTPRTTAWASLGGATLRMELDATVNTDGSLATLWGRSYFGQPEIPVNLAVTLNAEDLQVGGVICSSIVLEQPERDFVMDLENCVISRDTTHFTPVASFGFDKSPDFIPITAPVVNSTTSPSSTIRSCKFTSQPERNALPTTKVMACLNIISVTPELITAVITLEDNPLGATLLICATFASTHTNNIIPQSTTGRNLRSVWSFPTFPYAAAHFAVFPEKLPEICIKAATPEVGCCSKCGAPWERIVEVIGKQRVSWGVDRKARVFGTPGEPAYKNITETLGWQPTCQCNADKVPSTILDPFSGAGTSLWVAKKLNRRAIGFELSEEYCQLAVDRIRQQVMM